MQLLEFQDWLTTQTERVDARLARLSVDDGSQLSEALQYALASNGKRMRPALLIAAYEAASGKSAGDGVIELGCAIELIHTYSLIHDDLPCMDDDDLRRGRPALHRAYNTPTAMAVGGALIPLSFRTLLNGCTSLALDSAVRQRIARELARSAGGSGMVGGQVLDLESEGHSISLEDLEHLHRAKTGALIAAAVRIGGMAAGTSDEVLRALSHYGRRLGLAFQIADDVLDETEGSEALGKTAGKDKVLAKATFPALLGLETAGLRAREEIAQAVQALQDARIASRDLEAMAQFAIERRR